MNRSWNILKLLAFLLAVSSVVPGCIRDRYVPESDDSSRESLPLSDIVVRLRIGGQSAVATRTSLDPEDDEWTLGFTEEEHRINTLTLIMMRVADGREVFEVSRTVDVSGQTGPGNDGYVEAEFDLTGHKGLKHFYIGANMTSRHIGAFTLDDKVIGLDADEDGHNIATQLLDIDHESGAGSNILMTGVLTLDGSRDILLDETATDSEGRPLIVEGEDGELVLDLTGSEVDAVRLDKAVAKVLVTCKTAGNDAGYANVTDASDAGAASKDNTGWISMGNVRYLLNVMNRREYAVFREVSDGGGTYLTDPNYEMSDFIEYREDKGGYGLKNLADYQRNFVYYDTQQMTGLLASDEAPEDGDCRRSTVLPYDKTKLDRNDPENHYTDGLYCPENMVRKMAFNDGEDAEFMSVNRFVSTHIVIGARYTPKKIWIVDESSGTLKQATCNTEGEAMKLLPEIKNYEMPDVSLEYDQGTFWYETKTMEYYSFDAMRLKNEMAADLPEEEKPAFTRYDGGWCYYFSFIDGDANSDGLIDYAGQERWGVKRNHYYIVNITEIIAPGSAYPGNEMMRIHSELLDWIDKGGSDVELDVPQQ